MNTKSHFIKSFLYAFFIYILLIIPFFALFFMTPKQIYNYTAEDGLIENLSAIFYFMASMICFYIYVKFRNKKNNNFLNSKRNYFIMLLGLFFFVCFGEEISWAQRIFEFSSPDFFKSFNVQGETNLHNFSIIDGRNSYGCFTKKGTLAQWITIDGIFILIWFFYCFCIPIINTIFSKINDFTKKNYFPIIPVWLGVIFFLHQISYEVFKSMSLFPIKPLSEIKETNVAFLYLLVSISIYLNQRRLTS